MNKKTGLIIWSLAIVAMLTAAYVIYTKNNKSEALQSKGSISAGNPSQTSGSNTVIAPDFKLKDLDGKDVKLSDYKGKVVILNFWAVWCKYCIEEMPDLNALNKELLKDNEAVILAVNVQEPIDKVKNYLKTNNIDLKVLLDSDGSISQTYGVEGYPTTFVINKDGSLYTYIPGLTNKATLNEILDKIKRGEPLK